MSRQVMDPEARLAHSQAAGTIEGCQDETNWLYVRGWAWDRARPNEPVCVEIFDGERLVTTLAADLFRPDLRKAGKGNGCHGFVYRFRPAGWHRRKRRITVRVAGTGYMLHNPGIGGVPPPVTRGDRPQRFQFFSLSPIQLWLYYTLWRLLLTPFSSPIWRLPAVLSAALAFPFARDTRRLVPALVHATGGRNTLPRRWRMAWSCCYRRQVERLLLMQANRFSREWVRGLISCDRAVLPPDGAILIAPHHALHIPGALALATLADGMAGVTGEPASEDMMLAIDETVRRHQENITTARERTVQMTVLKLDRVARAGLEHLRAGGYLIMFPDVAAPNRPRHRLLGREVAISRGAAWLGQRSGRPIIPWMVVPDGRGWRLWFGEEVPATEEGVIRGIEACVRAAPASWDPGAAMIWLDSQPL